MEESTWARTASPMHALCHSQEPRGPRRARCLVSGVVVPRWGRRPCPRWKRSTRGAVFGTTFLSGVEEYLDNTTPGDAVSWGESRAFVPGVSS